MPTCCRYAPPILFWLWSPFSLFPRSCLTWHWIFFINIHWWVPPWCSAYQMLCLFNTLSSCIVMPTWYRRAPLILFCPRSCLTLTFFVDPPWWLPLCVQRPQISMCLFCFYLDLRLTCFCFVHMHQHAPPQIAGVGLSCYNRRLYFIRILTSLSYNLSFYPQSNAQPQNPVHHSTTWCERSLSQGSGVSW